SRETILPEHFQRRSRGLHLPSRLLLAKLPLSYIIVTFYSYVASVKRSHRFRQMPGYPGVWQQ
ncbi:MAG: hypothetical protein ABJ056_03830, partial [Halioglobus sp.]